MEPMFELMVATQAVIGLTLICYAVIQFYITKYDEQKLPDYPFLQLNVLAGAMVRQ